MTFKSIVRELRSRQPFNRLSATVARKLLRLTGASPEWFVLHLPRLGRTVATLPNGRLLIMSATGDDSIPNQVFWRGCFGFEAEMSPLFYSLATQAGVVLDIGAYTGYYTLLAARANPEGRVIALEPLPTVFERLLRNVALNGGERITCLETAAGACSGKKEFYYVDMSLPSSSSLSYPFMRGARDLKSCPVEVITIDQLVAEKHLGRIDLMKIDTESTEPDIIAGMPTTLRRDRPHIFCEVLSGHQTGAALQQQLEPHGYFFYQLTSDGPIPRERIEGDPQWKNYLFSTLEPTAVSELNAAGGRQTPRWRPSSYLGKKRP
jgi:FkbM family methyltransferase